MNGDLSKPLTTATQFAGRMTVSSIIGSPHLTKNISGRYQHTTVRWQETCLPVLLELGLDLPGHEARDAEEESRLLTS